MSHNRGVPRQSIRFPVDALHDAQVYPDTLPLPALGYVRFHGIYRTNDNSLPSDYLSPSSAYHVLFVPFRVLVSRLPVKHLQELAVIHDVALMRAHRSVGIVSIVLAGHDCGEVCRGSVCVFTPESPLHLFIQAPSMPEDMPLSFSLRSERLLPLASIVTFSVAPGTKDLPIDDEFEFCGHVRWANVHAASVVDDLFVLSVPLVALVPLLTYRQLLLVVQAHKFPVTVRICLHHSLAFHFNKHVCTSACGTRYAVFRSICTEPSTVSQDIPSLGLPKSSSLPSESPNVSFPPRPLGNVDHAGIVRDWCEAISYDNLAEGPCAVCGELVLISSLRRVSGAVAAEWPVPTTEATQST